MGKVADNPGFSFHPKCKRLRLNHLAFADDLMIICKADLSSTSLVKHALDEFGRISGLKTNPAKCLIFMAGVKPEVKHNLLEHLQFSEGTLPVRYLGIPLISTRLADRDCQPILDKIKRKIHCWSSRTLSYAGRIQLINSVIFHIQVYWSSVMVLPVSILKKIESLCLNFLWQGQEEKKAMALVSWQQICLPRHEGGLGVKQIKVWNKAALGKHIWNLGNKPNCLWASWMRANYLKGESFWQLEIPSDCFWALRKLLQLRDMYKECFKVIVGDGRETSLFFDWWTGDQRLADREGLKDEISLWGRHLKINSWRQHDRWMIPASFNRKWLRIAAEICQYKPAEGADKLVWTKDSSGAYSISAAYECFRHTAPRVVWPKLAWSGEIFPRHGFFVWLLCKGSLKTRSLLNTRGMSVENVCLLCNEQQESCSHLFFACAYTSRVWKHILQWLGYDRNPQSWNREKRWIMRKAMSRSMRCRRMRLSLACTVYSLWKERNSVLFSAALRAPRVLIEEILQNLQSFRL